MTDRAKNSRGYFEKVAQNWDRLRQGFFAERVREKALAAANIEAGQTAADIGAGSGFLTEALIKSGLYVIAVDRSPEMLKELQKRLGYPAEVSCRIGQAEQLPSGSAEVDAVFANMYLHHVESPDAAIREMVRILKPGGKLVITDLDQHDFTKMAAEHHDRWPGFKRDDVKNWLEDADLKNVSVNCLDEDCCATSKDGSEEAQVSIFIAVGERVN